MDAISSPVHSVAQAPARSCCRPRLSVFSSSTCADRNTFAFSRHSTSAVSASKIKPGQTAPVVSLKNPSSSGGKNPPIPPIAPTRPVTVPVSVGKYCGTSLNTAPLPRPSSAAHPRAPTVNGSMDGHAISSANGTTPKKTTLSTRAPPIRSESHPPTGRNSVASTTKPAVRSPASAAFSPNWSLSRLGR